MTWANRAPLLFSAPDAPPGQVVEQSFAEFVDIHPTLADLAGLAPPPRCTTTDMSRSAPSCTEGASLAAAVRGLLARVAFRRAGRAAITLQSSYRGHVARNEQQEASRLQWLGERTRGSNRRCFDRLLTDC